MKMDHIYRCTDLRREALDPEEFAHALALHHLRMLIANGDFVLNSTARVQIGYVLC
jgi:hypothetical protein